MTATELRSLERPVTPMSPDEVPPALLERAAAYNEAVNAFREAVRNALDELQRGAAIDPETAEALRVSAAGLEAARDWLLQLARMPADRRF